MVPPLYLGDYDYYLKKSRARSKDRVPSTYAVRIPFILLGCRHRLSSPKGQPKEERKLKRRIAEIEERLETIEARETEINEAMFTTNDFTQLADLQKN